MDLAFDVYTRVAIVPLETGCTDKEVSDNDVIWRYKRGFRNIRHICMYMREKDSTEWER